MADTRTLESPPMTVVERAKAFLAGTLEIAPLKLSEEAAGCLEMMFQQVGVVPTEKARREQTDALATQEHYAGKGPIVCARTPNGIVVLAVGSEEVLELVEGLTDEENLRLEIQSPVDPFMMRP
jgi:hypothetical protein